MGLHHSSCLRCGETVTAAGLGLPKTFTVLRELGYGNEGRTYLVRERTSHGVHLYACKAIPRGHLLYPDFVLRGLRNQSSLCFEHVVKFLEVILTPSHLITKFEYVGGGDLFRYVCRQNFTSENQLMDEEHARFLFIQILFGLYHCHEHRVAHRDIKFANILCTKSKNPIIKICDFGLSKGWEHPRDATSFTAAGTLMFMSPQVVRARVEEYQQEPYDLCKADVWGLGVILYTMFFGHFPFLNPEASENRMSRAFLVTGSTSTFSLLLRRMEIAHRSNPQRLTEEITSSSLSPMAKRLLLAMLAMDEKLRISLDDLLEHPWVKVGLSLSRAKAIYSYGCRKESGEDSTPYEHAELVMGSKADRELQSLVYSAASVGESGDPLVRWLPPGCRLKAGLTEPELSALAEEGIRYCSKCQTDSEDKYRAHLGAIRITQHH